MATLQVGNLLDGNGVIRVPVPDDAQVLRCWKCDKVVALSYSFSGRVEIMCKRCKAKCVFTGSGEHAEKIASRQAKIESSVQKLESMGFTKDLRPGTEAILELMETKYREMAKIRAQRAASVSVGLRFDVFNRDGFRCVYCGLGATDGAILHADHRLAESKGGATSIDNLVTACLDCNLGKSDKDLLEPLP